MHATVADSPRSTARSRAPGARGGWLVGEQAIMGTAIRVELWSESGGVGAAAIDAVMAEMHRIDRAMSPYKPHSELSRINRDAVDAARQGRAARCSRCWRERRTSRACQAGASTSPTPRSGISTTIAPAWRRRQPSSQAARAAIGWRNLILDPLTRTVRFARAGMRIDLGGFAKGHAVDCARRCCWPSRGIAHAIVSAGGDSRVLGDRRGRPWTVGIRDPRRPGAVVAVLPLEDTAMSTSGDYERYFERDGVRHHHLIDPRTGASPSSVRSVTILAPDGLTSEALSKSVFVLGLEQGMRLVETRAGVDAIVVDATGVLHFSPGLRHDAPPARQ